MELLGSDMPDLQEDALRVLLNALRTDPSSCDNFIKQGVILGVVAVCDGDDVMIKLGVQRTTSPINTPAPHPPNRF